MDNYSAICQRLPEIYRPEPEDTDLLARFIRAVAALIDETDRESSLIMQSHWFRYADDPRFDLYFSLFEKAAFPEGMPEDEKNRAMKAFAIINDLARTGSLFRLHPWQSAGGETETVEQFRKRISMIIDIYREGLGTRQAVENITRAMLPCRDAPDFRIEEFVLSTRRTETARTPGIPSDTVGPLMKWDIHNTGILPTVPTICMEGLKPVGNQESATRPEIELFSSPEQGGGRVAIACETDLEPGQALCIRPVYNSWIATGHGLMHASTDPSDPAPDLSASGPWKPVSSMPSGSVKHVLQTRDMTLWIVTGKELYSFDGSSWTKRADNLPEVYSLCEQEDTLLACTDSGIIKIPMYHPGIAMGPHHGPVSPAPPANQVFHITRLSSGQWWAGCAKGLRRWDNGSLSPVEALEGISERLSVYHIFQDHSGTVIMGSDMGVLLHQPELAHTYLLTGGQSSDTAPDWTRLKKDEPLPPEDEIFMPAVNAVLRSRDSSLWFGTSHGIACYRATPVRGLSYRTHLTAFPELGTGSVHTIREDQAGVLWFSCSNGLFRFDGVQWQYVREGALDPVPGMEQRLKDTRPWRFHRTRSLWQFYHHDRSAWISVEEGEAREGNLPANDIIWTTGAVAELGKWDGQSFTADPDLPAPGLRMRYKPAEAGEKVIVDGGIPGIPALLPGKSTWRYLRMEDNHEVISPNRPTWTCEGRLVPPPPDAGQAAVGRYSSATVLLSDFDNAVFAFRPCARVWFQWQAREPLTMQVRLRADHVEPQVLDRVWQGIQQVRPAGSRVELVLNSSIARGESNG